MKSIKLIIHGGAENGISSSLSKQRKVNALKELRKALENGYTVLKQGGTAKESVVEAILVLENSEYFNAGKGSVFTNKSTHELDAAIMCGAENRAGAIANVGIVKNPIKLAKIVMEESPYTLLVCNGAEELAKEKGLEIVNNAYFSTKFRKKELGENNNNMHFGTVGAVALDVFGNLASGTSTGGLANKKSGRVGDTPIIGAGTFASNICAVSATGQGEFFKKSVFSHNIHALMKYKNLSLVEAAKTAFNELEKSNIYGGFIALDKLGNHEFLFNTEIMYRGLISEELFFVDL